MEKATDNPVEEDIRTLHIDIQEEVERCLNGEWAVESARQSHKPLKDITRNVKERLKTKLRGMGV